MPPIRDDAVVLKRLDFSETSQVLALFTRAHGKVRAIAKGIKRGTKARFAVGADVLDIGSVVFSVCVERTERLATLIEWKQSRSLFALREKLGRIHGAQYAVDVTAALTEDWDPHAELFDALTDALAALCESADSLREVVRYQVALLDAIGSAPRFDACVLCGRESELTYFSSFEGGLVCRHCEVGQVEKRQLSSETVESLRGLATAQAPSAEPLSHVRLARAFTVLNYHLAHLMGREPTLGTALVPRSEQRKVE
jgi:DNA repair protein RecO (recombination protein O)